MSNQKKRHTPDRNKRTRFDANRRVPECLTQRVIDFIQGLGPDRYESIPNLFLIERSDDFSNNAFSPNLAYLQKSFLQKYCELDNESATNRYTAALQKWLKQESINSETNLRLQHLPDDFQILSRVKAIDFFTVCRFMVAEILGDTVPVEALIGSFSGGASTSRPRTESHPASKFTGKADITAAALAWWDLVLDELPLWREYRDDIELGIPTPRVSPGNKLFTVPKNAIIDRVAAKEPDLNMFMQKGVGDYIRGRLRRKGINLNDQSRNKSLAREGSITGALATIDLSSASDSVTRELVFELLPIHWFLLLDDLRSPVTEIPSSDELHRNEMFSSMGNGFTFELESLLFYVLARATAYFTGISGVISVYGDDLIVPTPLYQPLEFVLSICGFSVNDAKSFYTGDFRESCGGHYHSGADITPFYLKGPILRLTDLIHVMNMIRRWSSNDGWNHVLNDQLEPLWLELREFVPSSLWGGSDIGDKTRLVSDHEPRNRLVAIKKDMAYSKEDGYLHWHCSTNRRDELDDGIETSVASVERNTFRSRPVRKYTERFAGALWSHELYVIPVVSRA